MEQIAGLSIRQLRQVYFRNDEDDQPEQSLGGLRYIDLFKKSGEAAGVSVEVMKARWMADFAATEGPWED